MTIDVPGIFQDIGVSRAAQISINPTLTRCELWAGEDNSIGMRNAAIRLLILHSGFAADHISQAKQKLMNASALAIQIVLFEDSAPKFDLMKRVQAAFPESKVITIGACLRQAVFKGHSTVDTISVDYYVPPTIVFASGSSHKEDAISTLFSWIRGQGAAEHFSRVGVLLAPAGTGKTALAIELFKRFTKYSLLDDRSRRVSELSFPLLIDRVAWVDHEFRESSLNLAELVGNAILRQFRFQPSIDSIQRCLRYGAISPILDGFDELCVTNPSVFGADDTIAGLIGALDGVEGNRVLLTCRESFWHDNVDVKLQSKISAFRLSPFSDAQRREYLEKRFPSLDGRVKRERTANLLQKISSVRYARFRDEGEPHDLSSLPWVVQFAAEATDTAVMADAPFDPTGMVPDADPLGHVLTQFCRREQRRIGISLSPEGQIRFFSSLAAICDERFAVDQIEIVHQILEGEPDYPSEDSHIEFLRKHGFLRVGASDVPNNCRFEYPEVQDYLRAKMAVDAICGLAASLGDDEVFRRCAKEQARLVDFVSLLLRWRLPKEELVEALSKQRLRYSNIENEDHAMSQAGLFQILLRVLSDESLLSSEVTASLCHYFGDKDSKAIKGAYFRGLISRLDFKGVRFENSIFFDTHLEHCIFDRETVFENVKFLGEFGAALNCKSLGDVTVNNCEFSNNAMQTFRQHKNNVGRVPIDRSHIDDACHHILKQYQIGQMGLRTKAYDDIKREAMKASPIGEDLLEELIRSGVLAAKKGGSRKSLEVEDKSAVSAFIQQSTSRGAVAQALNKIARNHLNVRAV